jgi:hypothetical protein
MNERIEELAGQAFQFAADNADETGKGQLGVFAEKFAELIMLECVDICMKNQFDGAENHNNGAVSSAELIKEHFGVEE